MRLAWVKADRPRQTDPLPTLSRVATLAGPISGGAGLCLRRPTLPCVPGEATGLPAQSPDDARQVTGCALQFVQVGRTGVRLPPLASPDSMQPGSGGLCAPSRLRVDKITTVPKTKVGTRVGRLEDADVLRLNRAVLVFLGLAAPAGARRGS